MLVKAMWDSVDKWVSVYLALRAIKDDVVFSFKVTNRIIELCEHVCACVCVREREGEWLTNCRLLCYTNWYAC